MNKLIIYAISQSQLPCEKVSFFKTSPSPIDYTHNQLIKAFELQSPAKIFSTLEAARAYLNLDNSSTSEQFVIFKINAPTIPDFKEIPSYDPLLIGYRYHYMTFEGVSFQFLNAYFAGKKFDLSTPDPGPKNACLIM